MRRYATSDRAWLAADLIVLASGQVPDDALYRACIHERVAAAIHNIGDAFRAGRIFDATKAAYAVGSTL